jgi:transposase
MTRSLLELRDWLLAERVSVVGMESTGDYWKPVYYLLEDVLECQLLNPAHLKKVPGRKSDVSDAAWIAQLVEHGLVRPSFVPPPPIRELRDLTRYRTTLVRERTREVQRLHMVLEDAGIKLGVVISDLTGKSGRSMISALIVGDRDPNRLADLALGRMRKKTPELVDALTGRFNPAHHGLLCQIMLGRIDMIDATIERLDDQIETKMAPFRHQLTLLDSIPGVDRRVAEVIIAETGGDMTRFPTPADLSSWAGMCPGNNESAGKHFSGKTRPGNPWLRGALGQAAAAAAKTKNTYLAEKYRRLAHRRGKKRALVAVGRTILEASWQVLTRDTTYADLGPDHFTNRIKDRQRHAERLADQLRKLGYPVLLPQTA